MPKLLLHSQKFLISCLRPSFRDSKFLRLWSFDRSKVPKFLKSKVLIAIQVFHFMTQVINYGQMHQLGLFQEPQISRFLLSIQAMIPFLFNRFKKIHPNTLNLSFKVFVRELKFHFPLIIFPLKETFGLRFLFTFPCRELTLNFLSFSSSSLKRQLLM